MPRLQSRQEQSNVGMTEHKCRVYRTPIYRPLWGFEYHWIWECQTCFSSGSYFHWGRAVGRALIHAEF